LNTYHMQYVDHRERMLDGLPYLADAGTLPAEREDCFRRAMAYNSADPADPRRNELLLSIFGDVGTDVRVQPPVFCEYGKHTHMGDRFFCGANCTFFDVCDITFGDDVTVGPNVAIYTAGYPLHPETRQKGFSFGAPVHIGSRVFIGGSAVILAGVTIGCDSVIGAGSVVTNDIPEGVIAAGNPCRILRPISDYDRNRYFDGRYFPDPTAPF